VLSPARPAACIAALPRPGLTYWRGRASALKRWLRLERRGPGFVAGGLALNKVLSTIAFILLFVVYLVIEVFLAMMTYMYLNLYHPYTFGSLTQLASGLLHSFATYLQQLSPELATRAYATLLGELGPKSVLLLLIGLLVSALARLAIWAFRSFVLKKG
jgi:hypothetical protein